MKTPYTKNNKNKLKRRTQVGILHLRCDYCNKPVDKYFYRLNEHPYHTFCSDNNQECYHLFREMIQPQIQNEGRLMLNHLDSVSTRELKYVLGMGVKGQVRKQLLDCLYVRMYTQDMLDSSV